MDHLLHHQVVQHPPYQGEVMVGHSKGDYSHLDGGVKAEVMSEQDFIGQDHPSTGYQLKILGIPNEGTKSRVETQIKLCLQLVSVSGEKAHQWSQLRLPENLVVKEKAKGVPSRYADGFSGLSKNTLLLEAYVVCASDPTKQVTACFGCIQRERKRVKRKKEQVNSKTSGFMSEPQSPEADYGQFGPESSAESSGLVADQQKILLFNCPEVVDFASGDAILPTRLTCYCRHHNERLGFCVSFFIRDNLGNVLASAMSPPIMITDDHKSAKTRGVKRQRTDSSPVSLVSQEQPFFLPTADQDRVRRYNIPLSPNSPPFSVNDSVAAGHARPNVPHANFSPSAHLDGTPKMTPIPFKAEPFEQSFDMTSQMGREDEEQALLPEVARVVPTEGPLAGGIEVTVLGSNFYNGVHVMFGDNEAFSTHYWGPTTLICILPPSSTPGLVPVTIKENKDVSQFSSSPAGVASLGEDEARGMNPNSSPRQDYDFVDSILNTDVVMFNYRDDTDKELMELALQVVGLKLTGRQEDAKQIAMAILNQVRTQNPNQQGSSSSFNESRAVETLQNALNLNTPFPVNLSLETKTQQTMLHLATILNWPTLCNFLIEKGADLDVTDRNEFTALHFAAWLGRSQILKSLYLAGANSSLKNAFGQTPKDITHPKIAGIWDLMSMEVSAAPAPYLAEQVVPPTLTSEASISSLQPTSSESGEMSPPTSPSPAPSVMRSTSSESIMSNLSGDLSGTTFLAYTRPKIEKQRRRKRDRMIFTFWLPLMILVVALIGFQYLSAHNVGPETLHRIIGVEPNQV